MKKLPWLLLATPLGMLVLAGATFILYKVWHEVFILFLVLLFALTVAQERLMFRINLLGEGLHIHLDRAGTMGGAEGDEDQRSLLDEMQKVKAKLEELEEKLENIRR